MSNSRPLGRILSGLRSSVSRRLFALVVLSLGSGAFVAEYTRVPVTDLSVGNVATRTIRATSSFPFVDWEATLERQRAAEAREQPVFDFDSTQSGKTRNRVSEAFEMARHRLGNQEAEDAGAEALLKSDFLSALNLSLDPTTMDRLVAQGFSKDIESLASNLISGELGRFIIADRSLLPDIERPIAVVRILQNS
jgi:membrane-associated HD superfamily phosphohydrolase